MKLRKSCFGMDYEMETLIQALVIQINMVWNQFHEIIHELIRYAHALHLVCLVWMDFHPGWMDFQTSGRSFIKMDGFPSGVFL